MATWERRTTGLKAATVPESAEALSAAKRCVARKFIKRAECNENPPFVKRRRFPPAVYALPSA